MKDMSTMGHRDLDPATVPTAEAVPKTPGSGPRARPGAAPDLQGEAMRGAVAVRRALALRLQGPQDGEAPAGTDLRALDGRLAFLVAMALLHAGPPPRFRPPAP